MADEAESASPPPVRSAGRLLALAWPLVALALAAASAAWPGVAAGPLRATFELVILGGAVFASVHHADIVAHRTGEPYGTLLLTVAVTIIELALILSVMFAGDGNATLVRDTVFAVLMVVVNGLVGLCFVAGGLRHGEPGFRVTGTSAYLVVLMPLATLTLILPNYTTSQSGPFYTPAQLVFVSVATLALYGAFLYVQTVRHRDYFLSDAGTGTPAALPTAAVAWRSLGLLLATLIAIVLLAKSFSVTLKSAVAAMQAPAEAIGLAVALLVLLPESIAAFRSARRNQLQKSLNLALGSSLATIGLTIPAVAVLSLTLGTPLALGLDTSDIILLVLTFAISLVSLGGGRTNILPGFVHLVLFATYVFLIFSP